jgi:hypothetical protein
VRNFFGSKQLPNKPSEIRSPVFERGGVPVTNVSDVDLDAVERRYGMNNPGGKAFIEGADPGARFSRVAPSPGGSFLLHDEPRPTQFSEGFDPNKVRQPGLWENIKGKWQAQGGLRGLGQQFIPDQPGERYAGSEEYKGAGKPGIVGRTARLAGRVATPVSAGIEAYGVADDMKYLTPSERWQRGGEAMINTGLGGLGTIVGGGMGAFGGPIGMGVGGVAGVRKGSDNAGID